MRAHPVRAADASHSNLLAAYGRSSTCIRRIWLNSVAYRRREATVLAAVCLSIAATPDAPLPGLRACVRAIVRTCTVLLLLLPAVLVSILLLSNTRLPPPLLPPLPALDP